MRYSTTLHDGVKVITVTEPKIMGGEWNLYLEEDRPIGMLFAQMGDTGEMLSPYPRDASDLEIQRMKQAYLTSDELAVETAYRVISQRVGYTH